MNREIVITEDDLPPEVIRAIERGRKVEAIKLLRESTGLGLANAKVLVDKVARRLGPPSTALPGFVEEETNVTSLLKTLLLVVVLFAAYRNFFGG
jgi:hypothetical protein